jgi:hypothetical protein
MLYALAVVPALAWVVGFGVLNVGGGAVHLLLLFSAIFILWHFIKRRRTVVEP